MKILIGFEESGTVTAEFRKRGHQAFSCDLLPTRGNPDHHLQCDIRLPLMWEWDMVLGFPPCTYFCSSGVRWLVNNPARKRLQKESLDLVWLLYNARSSKVGFENPTGMLSTLFRKPDQYIQPWEFGHGEVKRTGLWLRGLPLLVPTRIVSGRLPRVHRMAPGPYRARDRSVTYQGIAKAMAEQWG